MAGGFNSLVPFGVLRLNAEPINTEGGYRSLFCFWLGGLSTETGITPPTDDISEYIVTFRRRRR